jgi:hypothetical protein
VDVILTGDAVCNDAPVVRDQRCRRFVATRFQAQDHCHRGGSLRPLSLGRKAS